jgi:hypothetical protein
VLQTRVGVAIVVLFEVDFELISHLLRDFNRPHFAFFSFSQLLRKRWELCFYQGA